LRGAHLAYYKSSAEYKLLKLLDLTDVHSVTSCSLKHHKFTFGIVSPSKTLYLQAESDADMAAWVQALNDARTALQNQPSIASAPTKPAGSEAIPIPPTTPRTSQTFVHNSPGRSIGTPSPPGQYIQTHHHHVASSDSEQELSPTAIHSTMQQQQQHATTALNAKGGAAAADASKTILAGYLMKCSSKRRNWRKRWFTLTAEKLVYTTSHMVRSPTSGLAPVARCASLSLLAGTPLSRLCFADPCFAFLHARLPTLPHWRWHMNRTHGRIAFSP